MEAADNESQLAGVLAHEIAHVALRHGTNQASKAATAQVPLAILGGLLGSDSTKTAIAELGASFAVNSILLKYSRTAETEADVLGTQILYDAGYDPRAMARFFEKMQAQQKGSGPVEFFSNHPSPDNRIERVTQEVNALGGEPRRADVNARAFDETTRYLQSVPAPKGQPAQVAASRATGLRIVSASYGASNRFIDVRERMQSRVENDRLDLVVNNSSMGGDPISQAKSAAHALRVGRPCLRRLGAGEARVCPFRPSSRYATRTSAPARTSGHPTGRRNASWALRTRCCASVTPTTGRRAGRATR